MIFSRIVLAISGFIFLLYGLWCLFDLSVLQQALELPNLPVQAITEFRAMYGGLQTALGLLFLLASVNGQWLSAGRTTLLLVIGSLCTVRLIGAMIDGSLGDSYTISALAYEWGTLALFLGAWYLDWQRADTQE